MLIQALLDKVGSRSAAPLGLSRSSGQGEISSPPKPIPNDPALSDPSVDASDASSSAARSKTLNPDQLRLLEVYRFAEKAHDGQYRLSGDPYITHLLFVADILADLNMDPVTLTAALLHDTLEDTGVTRDQLKERFGEEIVSLVEGVTKLSKRQFTDGTQLQAESLRKMLVAMAKDVRVILIKLADRLHNMRTLQYLPAEKQQRIARETRDIYAPLAHRLGMSRIRSELEDLCLRFLDPDTYYELTRKVFLKQTERDLMIRQVIRVIEEKLQASGLDGQVSGRSKHYASIWRKMTTQNKDFDEIYDLLAIRVLTNTVRDCYEILGLVHTLWMPMPGRFKDYIAMPKDNGYQSLHTTVMGPGGQPLEVQIRTREMHQIAEVGIAAHWVYKEGRATDITDRKFAAIRGLIELQQDIKEQSEFTDTLRMDIFEDEVFVFTPKGDVKELPREATALDFAYAVHTDVGNHCMGVKVNGHMAPLKCRLQSGDIVEVLTQSNRTPSRDWLKIVVTNRAKNKIRHWFRTHVTEEEIEQGRAILAREAERLGIDLAGAQRSGIFERLADLFNCHHVNELIANIGHGEISARSLLNKILQEQPGEGRSESPPEEKNASRSPVKSVPKDRKARRRKSTQGIVLEGQRDLLVRFARCCTPLPGDPIVGYITRGRGVSIHRADCSNTLNLSGDEGRMVHVTWDDDQAVSDKNHRYEVALEVKARDRKDLLSDILSVLSSLGVKINEATAKTLSGGNAQGYFLVEISTAGQMEEIKTKLLSVPGVLKAYRTEPR